MGGKWTGNYHHPYPGSTTKTTELLPYKLTQQGNSFISPSASSYPIRIWRTLEEINLVGKLDVNRKYTLFDNPAKVKFGGGYTYKYRDFQN